MEDRPGFKRPSVRPLLIAIAAFIAAIIAIPYIGWKVIARNSSFPESMPLPQYLKKGAVLQPMDGLKKTKSSAAGLGRVTDMRGAAGEIVLAGTNGSATIGADGALKSPVTRFSTFLSQTRIVSTRKDGAYIFVGESYKGIARIDPQGQAVWISTDSPMSLAVGAFDDKGPAQIAAGYSGTEGIVLTDLDGKRLWSREAANPWTLAFATVDGAGSRRLVNSNAGGTLDVRGKDGKASTYSTGGYLHSFAPIRWPGASGKPALVANSKGKLIVIDFKGKTLAELDSPRPMDPSESVFVSSSATQTVVLDAEDKMDRDVESAVFVSLKEGEPPYLAVSVELNPYERSTLNLYDSKGKLRFSEFLEQKAGPLLAAPRPDRPGAQRLLVGGEDQVFSYSF